ncbi:cytochrome P450 [Colletotrichum truncatum]|uniref:Cytochrome P450 n=1 Tax=Colletotrichum truncatum TaxID=5467 RepID=A0ACC3YGY1_COLTU|nr:cytochrome P450 [Colletotrichum truncatum]KAF6784139.1 cytochrome P450 [Colletotrichum truncatum]
MFLTICAAVVVAYYIVKHALTKFHRRRLAREHGCLPPQNQSIGGDPIIGLSLVLETVRRARQNEYLRLGHERFRKFGTTYVNKRLLYETVSTIDPENVKEVLGTSFQDFEMPAIRVKALAPFLGDGIFTTDGPQWAHSRSLMRPIFTKHNIAPQLGRFEVHVERLLHHIPNNGATVDLRRLFFNLTLDVATEFVLGRSTNTLDPQSATEAEGQFANDYMRCCEEAARVIQMGPFYSFSSSNSVAQERDRAWSYAYKYVDEVMAMRSKEKDVEEGGGSMGYNFLTELAKETDNRETLRDQVMNILIASRDTTAALLGNLFFMLARHPKAYAKLREEVTAIVGNDLPSEAHIRELTWLRYCINESLRLHPPIPANTRQATRDVRLPVGGGTDGRAPLLVKAGTNVLMSVFSMHRREDVFGAEPEEFRPQRWNGLRPGWAYLPFNGGARKCLGQQFAITEASYVIVRLAQTFTEIEPRDSRPFTEDYSIALFSKHGVQVGLKRGG